MKIKDLSVRQLEKLKFRCLECDYWFGSKDTGFFRELSEIRSFNELKGFIRGRIFKEKTRSGRKKIITFKLCGGIIKAAFARGRCIGMLIAGDYYLFPRLKSFNVFPPDFKSTFLACIYIIPEYKNMGVGKRLLIEIEKQLIKEKLHSIEAIGKRMDDDMDEEEYENSPLIPFKFLINNGFYLKKNDPLYPLLRLDLKSISFNSIREEVPVGRVALEKEIGTPL